MKDEISVLKMWASSLDVSEYKFPITLDQGFKYKNKLFNFVYSVAGKVL